MNQLISNIQNGKADYNTAKLQMDLMDKGYLKGRFYNNVNGIWGNNTQAAFDRYALDASADLYKLIKNSNPPSYTIGDIGKELLTNPASTMIKDAIWTKFRRTFPNFVQKYKLKPTVTESQFPHYKLKILDNTIKNKLTYNDVQRMVRGDTIRFGIKGGDYDPTYSADGVLNSTLLTKMFHPVSSLGKTIGGASVAVDKNGYTITDIYDFNPNIATLSPIEYFKQKQPYLAARSLANKINALETEPNDYKTHFTIKRTWKH